MENNLPARKTIYSRWLAEGLIKKGHQLIECKKRRENDLLLYKFLVDDTFMQDMNDVLKQRRGKSK